MATLTSAQTPLSSDEAVILAMHNEERAAVGVPPMRWDRRLAEDAQRWAEQVAREGVLRHSAAIDGKSGENLWLGTGEVHDSRAMVNDWASERRYYRPGRFPHVSATGDWGDVAHYTQMVWIDTRRVGCGIANGERHTVLVCRYREPGNIIGRRPI